MRIPQRAVVAKLMCVTVLDDIVAGVREDLAIRQSAVPLDELKARAAAVARLVTVSQPFAVKVLL